MPRLPVAIVAIADLVVPAVLVNYVVLNLGSWLPKVQTQQERGLLVLLIWCCWLGKAMLYK